jgi:hypothetical protein
MVISNMLDIGILLGNCDTLMLETLKTIEKQRWLDITVQEKSERIFFRKNKKRWTRKRKLINLC